MESPKKQRMNAIEKQKMYFVIIWILRVLLVIAIAILMIKRSPFIAGILMLAFGLTFVKQLASPIVPDKNLELQLSYQCKCGRTHSLYDYCYECDDCYENHKKEKTNL